VTGGLPWSLWSLTTICYQLGLDHHKLEHDPPAQWLTFLGHDSQDFVKPLLV